MPTTFSQEKKNYKKKPLPRSAGLKWGEPACSCSSVAAAYVFHLNVCCESRRARGMFAFSFLCPCGVLGGGIRETWICCARARERKRESWCSEEQRERESGRRGRAKKRKKGPTAGATRAERRRVLGAFVSLAPPSVAFLLLPRRARRSLGARFLCCLSPPRF